MTSLATPARTVTTAHTTFVAAPPVAVYRLIADVTCWPYLFPEIAHVERLAGGASEEWLRMWTFGNGAVRTWTSRRFLDRDALRVRFQQENPSAPVESMSGEWILVPLPGDTTSVVLLHEFRALGGDPVNAALIEQAVDRNSTAELDALKRTAELGDRLAGLLHAFSDSVVIEASLRQVYDFLWRAQDWPVQLPHVSRLVLDEAAANVQVIEMDSGPVDGPQRTTRLVRVCFPFHGIVFKQTSPPDLLRSHVGSWQLHPTTEGVRVTARNLLVVRPERAAELRGAPDGPDLTPDLVRRPVRENCLAVLRRAKHVAEGRARLP